jgi:hypothetical protein
MSARLVLLCLTLAASAGCDREQRTSYVIPGPSVPSSVPTATPFVWDSREELGEWVGNAVTRGSMTLEGSGAAAFIRLDRPEDEWTLRGPDLSPSPTGVRTARLRYRWRLDPTLALTASRTAYVTVHFDAPGLPDYQHGQASATLALQPSDIFIDANFTIGQYIPALDVRYFYVSSSGANRGVFEIDRIELVR